MPEPEIVVREDKSELAVEASDFVLREIQDSRSNPFFLALAGGSTPAATYRELAELPINWRRVHFFLSDERCVPEDDPNSNSRVARESLLDLIDIEESQIHLPRLDLDPDEAAASYESEVRGLVPGATLPSFDLILLGIGANGHTASIFPNEPEIDESERLVVATRRELQTPPGPPLRRLTFTFLLINAARVVAIIASGGEKAGAIATAMAGERPREITAGNVRPAGKLVWLLDRAAASRI
ncbi:MAG: 6-phosphogluconolactonase [Dehalococcoidia bacterium]